MNDSTTSQRSPEMDRAIEIFDGAVVSAKALNREDLGGLLVNSRKKLLDPTVTVLVVGEFKQGKSSLINALINAPICPVDDDVATCVPTIIEHADAPIARIYKQSDNPEQEAESEEISVNDLSSYASELGNPQNHKGIQSVEVGLPRQFLQQGVRIVDTPGVGGLESSHSISTLGALPMAEAVLFVSDASQELTAPEISFLETAIEMCPNVILIMTKIDFYPEWRLIKELNEGHLRRIGIDPRVISVSSPLRTTAVQTKDRALNEECGFPELVQLLKHEVVDAAEQVVLNAAMANVISVLDQLGSALRTEKDLIEDPSRGQEIVAELEKTKAQAESLRTAASKWQSTLNDGFADLSSNIDHDLRERIRRVSTEVDELINESDPAEIANELYPWIEQRIMAQIVGNYRFLTDEAEELATRVEEHFAGDESNLVAALDIRPPVPKLEAIGGLSGDEASEVKKPSVLMAMRSSYGGMMMFGMLGSVVGLAMFGPITLGAGVLMGRKAMKDDKERQLVMRRQQAKVALRKYVDEINFKVTKDSRDTLRKVQREIRDTNLERAKLLQRTTTEALQAAQSAMKTSQSDKQQRLASITGSLDRLSRIESACYEVAPILKPGGAA